MAANGRGNMRPAGRSPPFLAIGLFVALVILGFNYWSLSSRNGEQANEIVLLESELRLVNAKKTSAEKRSEAISDKVTELEAQINNQKEVIAKSEADRANFEKERQATFDRNNELENEMRGVRDQQLPACETDKKNLQQEVEQLRADIEVHKNKECGRSECEPLVIKERDGLIEEMYKVVGSLPLISMYKSNINLGSYKDQIARLAAQVDQEALKKQEQQQQQQQQQQGLDTLQQQQPQQSSDNQQQQGQIDAQQQQQPFEQQQPQQPIDTQQQQQQQSVQGEQQQQGLVDTQQQQAPVDTQQQQQAPVDTQQQQQVPVDTQQQQAPVDTQQQQAPFDSQQQQTPVDTQQQQQAPVDTAQQQQPPSDSMQQGPVDIDAQSADQNQQGVGPAPVMKQDPSVMETMKDTSNNNDADTVKAMDTDRLQNADQGAANQSTADVNGTKSTTKTTEATTSKPGINNDIPQNSLNTEVFPGQPTDTNKFIQPHIGDGNALTADAAANGADDDYDDEDDNADDKGDTLKFDKDGQDYDYDDADDDDDENDDYDYDKKTDDLKKDENGIDTMFQNDKRAAQTP